MTALSAITLAAAMLVLAATPGPGVFATISRALTAGLSGAAAVVAGIVVGDLVFLLIAIFGLGALAELLGDLFRFVQYAGALYLVWLGIRIWRQAVLSHGDPPPSRSRHAHGALSGLLITLGNPKVILFYLGFLPTFIDLQGLTATDVLIVSAIVSGVLGSTLLAYGYAAARAARLVRRPRTAWLMNRTSAGIMIATGTALALRS